MEEIEQGVHDHRRVEDTRRVASSTEAQVGSTGRRIGLSRRAERIVDLGSQAVVALLVIGWSWSIATAGSRPGSPAGSATSRLAAALTSGDAPNAAYLTDASLNALANQLRGTSGKLRVQIRTAGAAITADSLPAGGNLQVQTPTGGASSVVPSPGIFGLALAFGNAIRPISDFNVISMKPRSEKQNGKVGLYYIGNWPGERGGAVSAPKKAPSERYQPPEGFIEVTQQNADTRISDHFTLRNFLTHDQGNVWPKYVVIQMRNVDKLELMLSDLAARGIDVSGVTVMSGFRSPQYNAGGGNTGGRAGLSRHMYGDAADIFIDSNKDGVMDDLNHDGRVNIQDSRVMQQAVDRVEAAHPELVGGAGVYPAESGHGPFIHIDSRGYRARWVGSGGG